MESARRRALTDFYREEFRRHLDHLETNGIVNETNRAAVDRACRKILDELDSVCWRSEFPAVAETLLLRFDALTRLSELDERRAH